MMEFGQKVLFVCQADCGIPGTSGLRHVPAGQIGRVLEVREGGCLRVLLETGVQVFAYQGLLRLTNPCDACNGRGWLMSFNVDRQTYEIQRCDTCRQYDSDKEAGDVAVPLIGLALTGRTW